MKYIRIAPSVQNEKWLLAIVIDRYILDEIVYVTFRNAAGYRRHYTERVFLKLYKPLIEPNKIWKDLNEA